MPTDPDVQPDPIQVGDFGAAQTIEERCQAVHNARSQAIWDYLSLADRIAGPLPWCAAMPRIFDPDHLVPGHADSDWHTPHPLIDYYPGPRGLQHRVSFIGGRFAAHGVPASLLPRAPA